MRHAEKLIAATAFAVVGVLAVGGATVAVNAIESAGRNAISAQFTQAGLDWADVETDGLQVIVTGTTTTEAMRFRALSLAGGVVDPARVIDRVEVEDPEGLEPPRFSMELLRNDDGVSLIGLVPTSYGREPILERVAAQTDGASIADMLDSADHAIPEGWERAVDYGLSAMAMLPRSKISIAANHVAIIAISDSREQQREYTARLRGEAPDGLDVSIDISAPRPVITPFTLRFVIDDERGPRFDACSADSEDARARIIAAGSQAGASDRTTCTIGLGVPSPSWAAAAEAGIGALAALGAGTITFSDADVSLIVPHTVEEGTFDAAVGRLDSALPSVFSLDAVRLEEPTEEVGNDGPREFIATLSPEGEVLLRGLLTDERTREAVTSFARARFGSTSVQHATRLDPDMPEGWPRRVLTGMEALAELNDGIVLVREDRIEVRGNTGDTEASDTVSRILSDKLGRGQVFRIDISYDEKLDPLASLPTPQSCVADISEILGERQITFAPGSARIEGDSAGTLDRIAEVLRSCGELALEIGGHTDSQGRAEMNLSLSQQRANAVLEALLSRRVLVGQMTAVGYGQEQPVSDNATAAGREANRRIEFRLQAELEAEAELAERVRQRDPELEAALEITANMADDDTVRPRQRPEQD